MQPTLTSAIYQALQTDRQTQNQVLVQVMSGNIIGGGLFKHYIEQSLIISLEKFQNNQRSKHFQKSVVGPQRRLVGVQPSPVLPGHVRSKGSLEAEGAAASFCLNICQLGK